MIQAIVKKKDNQVIGFHIEGHSGYEDRGKDIVCAAVSALAINCVNSIDAFTEDRCVVESDEERGIIDLLIKDDISGPAELLLKSLVLGLEEISKSYGNQYLSVIH